MIQVYDGRGAELSGLAEIPCEAIYRKLIEVDWTGDGKLEDVLEVRVLGTPTYCEDLCPMNAAKVGRRVWWVFTRWGIMTYTYFGRTLLDKHFNQSKKPGEYSGWTFLFKSIAKDHR